MKEVNLTLKDIEMWVHNDEFLSLMKYTSGMSMQKFIKEYRPDIERVIIGELRKKDNI